MRYFPFLLFFSLLFASNTPPAIGQDAKQPPQPAEFEVAFDMSQQGVPLPRVFIPSIDISGRGFHSDMTWPQTMASPAVLDTWQKEIGFRGVYRLQFNLWEISQLEKNTALRQKLLDNYEAVIKRISDSGGTVILNIYSVPQGQGKVLDKTSFPVDLKSFKRLIKEYVRYFSCQKRYNVWYEVWSAPDLEDFFLGRKNDYLSLYRCVAEAVKELQAGTRHVIPVGGPSTSWWFRSLDDSTILSPERSLIYELIRYCYSYKLPLDFISWHAYSTDPLLERELTGYNKGAVALIREWLSYFGFPRETPLIVDEWNFDSGLSNILDERRAKGNVCASYLVSRLRNMFDADLNMQAFFSLEDFQENREGVVRNVGAFWYEAAPGSYKGGSKAVFNAFRMLGRLESSMLLSQPKAFDEFSGVIATRGPSGYAILIYNYADPEAFRSCLSRSIAVLNDGERRQALELLRDGTAKKIIDGEVDPAGLRFSVRLKALLKKAKEAALSSRRLGSSERQLRLVMKNLGDTFLMESYSIDNSCVQDCPFAASESGEIVPDGKGTGVAAFALKPYSLRLILLKPKPSPPPEPVIVEVEEIQPAEGDAIAVKEAVPDSTEEKKEDKKEELKEDKKEGGKEEKN